MPDRLLHPLPDDALAALQARYAEELDRLVDTAMLSDKGRPEDAGKREALRRHVVTAARFGRPVDARKASELAALSTEALESRQERPQDPLSPRTRGIMRLAGFLRSDASRYEDFFAGKERLYFPLLTDVGTSETEREVTQALHECGFTVTDYAAGKATDARGKQSFRIGKLLGKRAPWLLTDFENDTSRAAGRTMVCLSRDPLDIARMSTARNWTSCMRKGGLFFDYVKWEVGRGSLVAYLVSENDPEISRPLGRILLKPFRGPRGGQILRADKAYGLGGPAFEETARQLAADISADQPSGEYRLRSNIYRDEVPFETQHIGADADAEDLLRILGAPYRKHADGTLAVSGGLSLHRVQMERLPDMSAVTIAGDFLASGCGLRSLQGMPQRIGGSIDVSRNRLSSLEGMPPEVMGAVYATDNRLVTLQGGPRRVGGVFTVDRNRLTTLDGAPDSDRICKSGNPLRDPKPAVGKMLRS